MGRAITDTYMICDAYESGFGKGLSGRPAKNPMAQGTGVTGQCHEAWDIGFEAGRERYEELMADKAASEAAAAADASNEAIDTEEKKDE